MTVRVRDAGPSEGGAIEAVTVSAYQQYAAVVPALWERYRENIVATLAAAPPGSRIVAEADGRIVGAVLLYPAGTVLDAPGAGSTALTEPMVRLLAVAPSARGAGIGALLMDECARRAKAAGAPALALHTTDMMQAAMRLYGRLGFERAPALDFEPAPGVVAKGFRLDLGAGISPRRAGDSDRRR